MPVAALDDIHGNLLALQAVLLGPERIAATAYSQPAELSVIQAASEKQMLEGKARK